MKLLNYLVINAIGILVWNLLSESGENIPLEEKSNNGRQQN